MSNNPVNPLLKLPKREYILGSASPRRRQLLKALDIDFASVSIDADESLTDDIHPTEASELLARRKSIAYGDLGKNELLITADTIVILDQNVINKPNNESECRTMLERLSNRTHEVITGVHLRSNQKDHSFRSETSVQFGELSQDEIEYYINIYSPLDKAGGYGIQEWLGFIGIIGISGCYYNVMGLPLNKLYRELCAF